MRKIIKTPVIGQKKIITKFLLFPKIINFELRWLEYSTYSKVYDKVGNTYSWINLKWED